MNLHLPHSEFETIAVTVNKDLALALNSWRHKQSPVPSPNEAIYQLLFLALAQEGETVGSVETEMVPSPLDEDPKVARLVAAMRARR